MGYLYVITNKVNGKKYVGKTYDSVSNRWRDHLKKSKSELNRPLYRAIAKYGSDSFVVETIAEYPENDLEAQEELLIAKLGTFGKNGYNATKGGDGRKYITFTDKEVIDLYTQRKTVLEIAKQLKSSKETINLILNRNNVKRFSDTHIKAMTKASGTKVELIDTAEVYESMSDCARDLIALGIANGSVKQIASNISRAATGSRKSYLGMNFRCI